jgi:hypothetical protein
LAAGAFVVEEMGDCSPSTCRPPFLTFDKFSDPPHVHPGLNAENDL